MTTLERLEEKQVSRRPATVRGDRSNTARDGAWARGCATAGAAVWAGMAVLARMGIARIGAIELLFLFAPLVIAPLGMELGRVIGEGGRLGEMAWRLQPLGAICAVVAMLMTPGLRAGLVGLGWMLVCALMAADGLFDLMALRKESPFLAAKDAARNGAPGAKVVGITLAVAKVDLAVGGAWLVASRLGMRPMGIQEPIGLLTAVHFHYAGFATATIAAATLGFQESRPALLPTPGRSGAPVWFRYLVLAVAGLPFVVAAGFVISPALKMLAATAFSICVAGLAVWVRACGRRVEDGMARVLLQVAAGAVFAGMMFAGAYAVADFLGSDVLPIPQMARTHGLLNSVGFCLLGLMGWLVEGMGQGR